MLIQILGKPTLPVFIKKGVLVNTVNRANNTSLAMIIIEAESILEEGMQCNIVFPAEQLDWLIKGLTETRAALNKHQQHQNN